MMQASKSKVFPLFENSLVPDPSRRSGKVPGVGVVGEGAPPSRWPGGWPRLGAELKVDVDEPNGVGCRFGVLWRAWSP